MFLFRRSPERAFWAWFQKNEDRLFNFEQDQERVFVELSRELHKVNPELAFEFSPVKDGRREFVVSAEGVRAAFPAVDRLLDSAPPLARWRLIKFRPRRWPLNDLQIGDLHVSVSDVRVALARHGQELAILIFVPGVQDEGQRVQFGFLFLDEALGEFDVATRVGPIEFCQPDEHPELPRFPLTELPKRFDEAYAQLAGSM